MNALLAANWHVLLAFGGGTLLGILTGYLLRSWRDDDAPIEVDAVATTPRNKRQTAASASVGTAPASRAATADPDRAPATAPTFPSTLDLWEADASDIGPAVLLVDDRPEMLGIHAAYLRKSGYRVLLAYSGTDGLAFARAYRPALIVLDQSMPDRTGVEVARELKADPATARIPILLMTALSYGAVGAAAIEAGCEAFLPKPVEPSRLLREIEARAPRH